MANLPHLGANSEMVAGIRSIKVFINTAVTVIIKTITVFLSPRNIWKCTETWAIIFLEVKYSP